MIWDGQRLVRERANEKKRKEEKRKRKEEKRKRKEEEAAAAGTADSKVPNMQKICGAASIC